MGLHRSRFPRADVENSRVPAPQRGQISQYSNLTAKVGLTPAEDRIELTGFDPFGIGIGQYISPFVAKLVGEPVLVASEVVGEIRLADGRDVDVTLIPAVGIGCGRDEIDFPFFEFVTQAELVHFIDDLPVRGGELIESDEVARVSPGCFADVGYGIMAAVRIRYAPLFLVLGLFRGERGTSG